jgi:hypothetical protein
VTVARSGTKLLKLADFEHFETSGQSKVTEVPPAATTSILKGPEGVVASDTTSALSHPIKVQAPPPQESDPRRATSPMRDVQDIELERRTFVSSGAGMFAWIVGTSSPGSPMIETQCPFSAQRR